MPTIKQKKAVENLVGNGGNVTKAMRDAEYSENTLNTPQKLTKSKGFEEILEEQGLTDEFLTNALVEDIKGKPKNRKPELELGFKIKGRMVEKHNAIGELKVIISEESAKRYGVQASQDTESSSS